MGQLISTQSDEIKFAVENFQNYSAGDKRSPLWFVIVVDSSVASRTAAAQAAANAFQYMQASYERFFFVLRCTEATSAAVSKACEAECQNQWTSMRDEYRRRHKIVLWYIGSGRVDCSSALDHMRTLYEQTQARLFVAVVETGAPSAPVEDATTDVTSNTCARLFDHSGFVAVQIQPRLHGSNATQLTKFLNQFFGINASLQRIAVDRKVTTTGSLDVQACE